MSLALALAAAATCVSGVAFANGRFPRAERLVEAPGDPDRLVLAATYGLLTTRDRGASWRYVCEKAFSLQDIAFLGDPLVDFSGGDLFAGVQSSLNVSRDDGCRFDRSLADPHQIVEDFTIVRASGALLAIVQATDGTSSHLDESTDRGVTWNAVGGALPANVVL